MGDEFVSEDLVPEDLKRSPVKALAVVVARAILSISAFGVPMVPVMVKNGGKAA